MSPKIRPIKGNIIPAALAKSKTLEPPTKRPKCQVFYPKGSYQGSGISAKKNRHKNKNFNIVIGRINSTKVLHRDIIMTTFLPGYTALQCNPPFVVHRSAVA